MRTSRILALFCALSAGLPVAEMPVVQAAETGISGESAFVEHRVALQLSDADAGKHALILSVANNILKYYGPDKVAIEIIAFGPGISLLRSDSPDLEKIHSLVAQGVKFDACGNTMDTIERQTGKPFPLNPSAQRVPAGVVQLITLQEHGYTIIRP